MKKYLLFTLSLFFTFLSIPPVLFAFTVEPSEDCMIQYIKDSRFTGIYKGIVFSYDEGFGHIQNISTLGGYNEKDVSGKAYGCLILDKNFVSSYQNTLYCTISSIIY